jgi:hypothetical protein
MCLVVRLMLDGTALTCYDADDDVTTKDDEMETGNTEPSMDRASELEAHKEKLAAEGYARIKTGAHWTDWTYVADGLAVGRTKAFRMSGTNNENDPRYKRAFSEWMAERPWAKDLDRALRSHLKWVADYRSEIEEWRSTLAQNERAKLNHPTTLKRKFDAAHKVFAKDPNAPKKPNDKEALIARNAELEAENAKLKHQLRTGNSGSLFNILTDKPDLIGKIIVEEMVAEGSFTKAKQIRAALNKEIETVEKKQAAIRKSKGQAG